ncbi:hypothetical protein, partial [Streptomyces sp. P17]|uniref:hypothetical protein n=1 Tax=Streptomyces sp. P17 TaxID=3074716 RepID=UPI0028F3E233
AGRTARPDAHPVSAAAQPPLRLAALLHPSLLWLAAPLGPTPTRSRLPHSRRCGWPHCRTRRRCGQSCRWGGTGGRSGALSARGERNPPRR